MARSDGTGVATYARALHRAQTTMTREALLLNDKSSAVAIRGHQRYLRWLRALVPKGVHASPHQSSLGAELRGGDIFRLGQVWFDVHRRLLPVHVSGPPGIMHWSCPVPLRIVGWSNVYTVHDAIPLVTPQLSPIDPTRQRRLLQRILAEACRNGALVTVSETALREVRSAIEVGHTPLVDCSQAVQLHDDPAVALPAGLSSRAYLLVCGSIERRKNSGAIAEAYRLSSAKLPLVFAGPQGSDDPQIVLQVLATPGVIRLSDIDRPTMIALIARARALLMPSLAEGFGLPVAEAMAVGTPVLTSCSGALAESAGGAALLVDPRDPTEIATGIRRLLDDATLVDELIAKGQTRVLNFTPERFAQRLAALYEQLIALH